jgi:hypothetical protein
MRDQPNAGYSSVIAGECDVDSLEIGRRIYGTDGEMLYGCGGRGCASYRDVVVGVGQMMAVYASVDGQTLRYPRWICMSRSFA